MQRISPERPARSRRRSRFLLFSAVAAALLIPALLTTGPAHAASADGSAAPSATSAVPGSQVPGGQLPGGQDEQSAPTENDDDGDDNSTHGTTKPDKTEDPDDSDSDDSDSDDVSIELDDPGSDTIKTPDLDVTGTVSTSGDADMPDSVTVTGPDGDHTADVSDDGSFSASVHFSSSQESAEITASVGDDGPDDSFTVNVLLPPSISTSGPVTSDGYVSLEGTAVDGAEIEITGGAEDCTVTADGGAWSCDVEVDRDTTLSVTQQPAWAGHRSNAATIDVTYDETPPDAPSIDSPSSGTHVPREGAHFSGMSEPGTTVKVFAGSQTLCTTTADEHGHWSCRSERLAKTGSVQIEAVAWEGSGNQSDASSPITLVFDADSSSSSPDDSNTPDETSPDSERPDEDSETPSDPDTDSDDSDSHTEAVPPPPDPPLRGPGPWANDTPFTSTLPSAFGAEAIAGWLRALLLAVLTVFLVLVPARMLAAAVARRRRTAPIAIAGRNKPQAEFDRAPQLPVPNRIAMVAIGMAITGGLVIFAHPIGDSFAYVRLLVASVLAVALINGVSWWVPRILVHVWQCGYAEMRFNPRWLIMVVAAVLASRVLGLHPALLFGLVTAVRVPSILSNVVRAELALARIGGVFTTGVLAWLLASLVPAGGNALTQMLIETANITALVGIGSAALMMIPLGRLSGRAIFAWSRPLWLAAVLGMLTALFVMLGPSIASWRATGNVLAAIAFVLAFAAVGISVWLWKRYVQPNLTA